MATGESITPSTDVIMKSTSPTTPAVGASIDPTNYYGQSFVYDEWVKAKVKELNQPTLGQTDMEKLAVQQDTYKAAGIEKESDLKSSIADIDKIVNEKSQQFQSNNSQIFDPVGTYKAGQKEKAEKQAIIDKILSDKDIRIARGYDPDTGRTYGQVPAYAAQVIKIVEQKYPEYVNLIKGLEPKYGDLSRQTHNIEDTWTEDMPWSQRLGTSMGAQAGNVTTPVGQLEAYQTNIRNQKATATDAVSEMKNATSQEAFDAAQKKYDNAIDALKSTAKSDISKITVWTAPKTAQGYGEGGKLGADVYGELANKKYQLESSIAASTGSSTALGNALNKIVTSGGNINAEQLQDLGSMKGDIAIKANELSYTNTLIDYVNAQNKYLAKPSNENLQVAQTMEKRAIEAGNKYTLAQQKVENPETSTFMSGLSGKNVIGKNDNLIASFSDTNTIDKTISPIGKIGGSNIYGTSKGEVVSGISNQIVPLSTITQLRQMQHQTGEYTPYGVYQISNVYKDISGSQKEKNLKSGVPLSPIVGQSTENLANIQSEMAAVKLLSTLVNPDIIDKYAGAKMSMGKETTPEGLPIVRYNQNDYVIPKTGSPTRLSVYTSLPTSDKSIMSKTLAENLLPPDAPKSAVDIVNASTKYGGSLQANNARVESSLKALNNSDNAFFSNIDNANMTPSEYSKVVDIWGKQLVTGNLDKDTLGNIGKSIDKRNLDITIGGLAAEKRPILSSSVAKNIVTDVFGNSTPFTKNAINTSKSVSDNITTSNIKKGSPSKSGLNDVLVRVGNVSGVKTPSTTSFDFGNLFGSKKKKEGGSVSRKSKMVKPKVDIKKSLKSDKNIIKMDTKIKSEIPGIDISDLKFMRGKVANNRVGVIDTEFIGIKNIFKIPTISIGNKKKRVK
jgi:hypothetical protein